MISEETKDALYRADVHRRGVVIAVIVGTILNFINQGPNVMAGEPLVWAKLLLTYLVPYLVSVYSAVASQRK